MATWDYEYETLTIEFHYNYEAGEPMIWSYPNGDPGHPGSGPEVNTVSYTHLTLPTKA